MSTCTIIIKIKDYFPKSQSIPYENYICLFTNGENEGQIPLVSKENESYQHQIKNVVSDIKYKVHVLDFNDMSLIGMCEMVISYNIISQISPPNGFIQEQHKKLLMDLKTKRKLFGTVLNMGDIYLNIYSEIYLSEKNNSSIVSQNSKSTTTRKKNVISINNSGMRKKLDGSPRTVHKKKLLMEMNSDRQAIMNINKNTHLNISNFEKQKNLSSNNKTENKNTVVVKPNISFNYKDVKPKESKNGFVKLNNNMLKNKTKKSVIAKKSIENKYNTEKDKNNLSHNNLLNRFKTESNKNQNEHSKKKKNKYIQNKNKGYNDKISKGGLNNYNNVYNKNKNLLMNNISPKILSENYNENDDLQFNNNTGNKITTIESLENIDFSGKKYITKAKTKKNNSHNNINSNISNTLFSTNSTEQEINDIDKIIFEKNNEIRNDFNTQLKNKNINENLTSDNNSDYINKTQSEIKNNFINLIDFYSLLNHKILKLNKKNINLGEKSMIYKGKLFTELKKNNVLTQKKTLAEIENFINVNHHGCLNEKFLRAMIKLKKSEFKIYQNIFNLFYYEYDILKFKEYEKSKKMDQNMKIELLLVVFKNLLKNYGNISQIYMNNSTKKNTLKNCLTKYGLREKSEGEINNANIDSMQNENKSNNEDNNLENKENKNEIDKFKVIKEEDEEKEDEIDDEDVYNNMLNNNHITYSNSNTNTKENINMFNSNEKLKSNNKSNKAKSGQKKLFGNDDKVNNIDNKKLLDIIKDNNDNLEIKNLKDNKNSIIDDINNLINFNNDINEVIKKIENHEKKDDKKLNLNINDINNYKIKENDLNDEKEKSEEEKEKEKEEKQKEQEKYKEQEEKKNEKEENNDKKITEDNKDEGTSLTTFYNT